MSRFLTASAIAEELDTSLASAYRIMRAVGVYRILGCVRVARADFDAWRGRSSAAPTERVHPDGVGTIYFILNRESQAIKIGFTSNPVEHRLSTLQSGSPAILSLLGSVSGTREDERQWHLRFEALRIRGEWFRAEEHLLKAIRDAV